MIEIKLERKILYIVVFTLLGALLTLIFDMFTTLDMSGEIDKQLERVVKVTTILGVIITVITVIIAKNNLKSGIEQLKEMKLQRTHSQEPDLFIEPKNLTVEYKEQEIIFDAPWRSSEIDYNNENFLPITLTNIGNGVAKYVTVSMFFERDYLYEVEGIDKGKIFNIRTFETEYGMDLFQYEHKIGTKKSMHNFDMDETKIIQFNYIKSEQSVEFLLEYNFMKILNLNLFLNGKLDGDERIFPRIKANITYFDSFDNKYTKDVDIYIGSSLSEYDFYSGKHTVSFELNGLNRLPKKQLKN